MEAVTAPDPRPGKGSLRTRCGLLADRDLASCPFVRTQRITLKATPVRRRISDFRRLLLRCRRPGALTRLRSFSPGWPPRLADSGIPNAWVLRHGYPSGAWPDR